MKRLRVEKNKATVFFDLETSGFDPLPICSGRNRTVQISAQVYETGQFFDSFVNPELTITTRSQKIHNVTNEMVKDTDNMEQVIKKMWKELQLDKYNKVTFVAHNCYDFDKIILLRQCGEFFQDKNIDFWDTLPWLRHNVNNIKKDEKEEVNVYKLEFLYEYFFEKKLENAHRSDADVRALVEIYKNVIEPNLMNEDVVKTEVFYDTFKKENVTSVKHIGPGRAVWIYDKLKINYLPDLKKHFKEKCLKLPTALDIFLVNEIKIRSRKIRYVIISDILDIGLYEYDRLRQHVYQNPFLEDCVDEVDYYVKYRYEKRKRPRNWYIYENGLTKFRKREREF